MRNALPFKPLTTSILIAALFSLSNGAMAADSYGINASKEDKTFTDLTEIKDVDYGIYVSGEHTADISSQTDLSITAKKDGTKFKGGNNNGGKILLTAGNTLTVTTTAEGIGRGLRVETNSKNLKETGITAQAKNIYLTVNSSTNNGNSTANGICISGKANSTSPNKAAGLVTLTAEEQISITTSADKYSEGISVDGSDSSATLTSKNLSIKTLQNNNGKHKKGYAHGIISELNGLVDINATESVDIRVTKRGDGEAFALKVVAGPGWEEYSDRVSTIDIQANNIKLNASAETTGNIQTSAIYLLGGRGESDGYDGPGQGVITLKGKNIDLSAAGGTASGVTVVTGGNLNLGDETTDLIRIYSAFDTESGLKGSVNDFTGLYAGGWDSNNESNITANGKTISITAEAQTQAVGVMAGSNSRLNIGGANTNNVDIRAIAEGTDSGTLAYGVWVLNTEISKNTSESFMQTKGGQASIIGKNIYISAEGAGDVRGVFVASNLLEPSRKAELTLTGDTVEIMAKSTAPNGQATGISAMSSGVVNISGDTTITADCAILARGDATVAINKDGKHSTRIDGDIVFSYDGDTSKTNVNANIDITLVGSDSYWNGNTSIDWNNLPGGTQNSDTLNVTDMKLALKDGAQWTPKTIADTDSTAANGQRGISLNQLTMDHGVINIVDHTVDVKVDTLTGAGTVKLATDLSAKEGNETGTFTVGTAKNAMLDVQLMDKANEKPLTSDEVTPEYAKKLLTNVSGDQLSVTTHVDEGMYKPGFAINANGGTQTAPVNTVMQTGLELAAAAPLSIHRMLITDVRKRLGDIRSMNGTSGAWARYDGGRLSGSNGLENDFHTVQVGLDTQPTADPIRLGAAFSYTMSDTDYARGTADTDAYSLAAYGLWFDNAGRYVDLVARVATLRTDMAIDVTKKGTMDSLAVGLSGEFGWRLDLPRGFYVEPQVEVSFTHVNPDDLRLSDGSTYAYDSVKSFVGRTGVSFGLTLPDNMGNIYAHLGALHEFLGDAAVTGRDGSVQTLDGKDTWIEYGLGANISLTKAAYLWADLERTNGSVLDEDYRATLGVRYVF